MDKEEVWRYLSRFTDWHPYQHKVLGYIDGQLVPLPFNLTSLRELFPVDSARRVEAKLTHTYGFGKTVRLSELRQSDDGDLALLGSYVYEKVFLHYTLKQWGVCPEELAPEVSDRVPVRISRDDRYFPDRYQGLPKQGYTRLCERMLDHPNIKIMLQTDAHELIALDREQGVIRFLGQPFHGTLVYTGMLDMLFGCCYGALPYRTLRFEHESLPCTESQRAAVINYPNDYEFTRVTEFKHMTGQRHACTSVVREYPCSYDCHSPGQSVPCYPFLQKEHVERSAQYIALASRFQGLLPLGRLAEYRYYDMDDVVDRVLAALPSEGANA